MVIKTIEYNGKYAHGLWVGPTNAFYYDSELKHAESGELAHAGDYISSHGNQHAEDTGHGDSHDEHAEDAGHGEHHDESIIVSEPVTTVADKSTIALAAFGPSGAATEAIETDVMYDYDAAGGHQYPTFDELSPQDQNRTHIFFQIYYCMTGLHGLHVLVGMAVLFWLLYLAGDTLSRAWIVPLAPALTGGYFIFLGLHVGLSWATIAGVVALLLSVVWTALRILKARALQQEEGKFDSGYFTPVEVGGLYWHLVDLIWIFLFPLLYLIH